MPQLKILISGAGIAGNALAFWLHKLGHEVTVVERFPSLRDSGLQVDLRGHGIDVLKRMGLEQAFRDHAAPEQGLQFVDRKGKRQAFFPANQKQGSKKKQSFTSEFEIMRGDFCRIMYDVAKGYTRYIFGTSIEKYEEKDGGLEVHFSNDITEQFDLLIGADGQGSRTRKMMLGADTPDAFHPLNECTAYFTIPRPVTEGEQYLATTYCATGGRFVMTRRSNPNEMQVYLTGDAINERLKSVQKGDTIEEKKAFTEVFQGAGWHVDEILASMQDTDNFYCERQGLVKLDIWSQGRVVLVGDAAYCPTSSAGMGTTSALVGAYVLAGEISKHCRKTDQQKDGIAAALKAYENSFRPFMTQVQKGVGEPSLLDKIPWTTFTVGILNRTMWLVSFLKLDIFALTSQEVKEWKLPEYEELMKG